MFDINSYISIIYVSPLSYSLKCKIFRKNNTTEVFECGSVKKMFIRDSFLLAKLYKNISSIDLRVKENHGRHERADTICKVEGHDEWMCQMCLWGLTGQADLGLALVGPVLSSMTFLIGWLGWTYCIAGHGNQRTRRKCIQLAEYRGYLNCSYRRRSMMMHFTHLSRNNNEQNFD